MEKDIEYIYTEFNQNATELFFSLYQKFTDSVLPLNRKVDDNTFHLLQGKYLHTLKQQLADLAMKVIEKNKTLKNLNTLKRILTGSIDGYINEFSRKSRSF